MNRPGLPDFLIIGAPRAGTTTLFNWLGQTAGIAMSRVKEPRFFSRCVGDSAFFSRAIATPGEYGDLWRGARPGDLKGEASPIYLHDPGSPKAVSNMIPDAKLIASLRNPVDRAVSHYRYHELRTGRSEHSFEEAFLRGLDGAVSDYHSTYITAPGFYARNIRRWLEHFSQDQLHVVIFEEMVANPSEVLGELSDFLGVNSDSRVVLNEKRMNQLRLPRNRWVTSVMQSRAIRTSIRAMGLERIATSLGERALLRPASRADLKKIAGRELAAWAYRKDVADLSRLLRRDLPWDLNDDQEL